MAELGSQHSDRIPTKSNDLFLLPPRTPLKFLCNLFYNLVGNGRIGQSAWLFRIVT